MNSTDVKNLKAKIKAEMQRRNGYGSLTSYAGTAYDFSTAPAKDVKILEEHGKKTIDLILRIEDYKDLKLAKKENPIPKAFDENLYKEIDRLATEKTTGESKNTVKNLFPSRTPETSSCRGDCSGLCVGSCINHCNGCTSCTATCGTGCAGSSYKYN